MRFQIDEPLVVIVGPTAVGKSEIAVRVAEKFGGEIVSADSCSLYKGMDIGTDKPDILNQKKIKHHLIDVAEPDAVWGVSVYKNVAMECIKKIHANHKLPILVGGTGQYVHAIIRNWKIPEVEPNERMRSFLTKWADEIGNEGLLKKLSLIDSTAAGEIDARNLRRIIRAIEVPLITGIKFSANRGDRLPLYNTKIIGIIRPRKELYERIDQRIDRMISRGLVDEVKQLLAKNYSPELPSFSAIGYKEIADHLFGNISLAEAIQLMKKRSRIFVRRQANWFKLTDPKIKWFQVDRTVVERISSYIESEEGWLSKSNAA